MSGFNVGWTIFEEKSGVYIHANSRDYVNTLQRLMAKAMEEGAAETAHMIDEEISKFKSKNH